MATNLRPTDDKKLRCRKSVQTRLQAKSSLNGPGHRIHGIISAIYTESGFIGLWKPGLSASISREMLYSGSRAGLYVPIRNYLRLDEDNGHNESVLPKIIAALMTGTIGSLIANPIDVIKIRAMVNPTEYQSIISGASSIYYREGVAGLYKGLLASTLRGAMISVGELATYDQAKHLLKKWTDLGEGWSLHICSSLITGLVATTVAAPFDLLKTRAMNTATHNLALSKLAATAVREEGIQILFRGWIPAYCRLGPHAIICFPIFEQLRHLMGLDYL